MEVFTFMYMGGAKERIELRLIANPGQDQAAAKKELTEQLATFDAAKAQCFKQEDRQRLLAVIEAGFGNFHDFNKDVRTAFDQRMRVQRVRKLRNIFRAALKTLRSARTFRMRSARMAAVVKEASDTD